MGDRSRVAQVLTNLALSELTSGKLDASRAHLEESAAIRRALREARPLMKTELNLAAVMNWQGESEELSPILERLLARARDFGDRAEAVILINKGWLLIDRGDAEAGRLMALEALRAVVTTHDNLLILHGLETVARAETRHRRWRRAAVLLGTAQAVRAAEGRPLYPLAAAHAEELAGIRAALGDEMDKLLARGAGMSLAEAAALALALPEGDA